MTYVPSSAFSYRNCHYHCDIPFVPPTESHISPAVQILNRMGRLKTTVQPHIPPSYYQVPTLSIKGNPATTTVVREPIRFEMMLSLAPGKSATSSYTRKPTEPTNWQANPSGVKLRHKTIHEKQNWQKAEFHPIHISFLYRLGKYGGQDRRGATLFTGLNLTLARMPRTVRLLLLGKINSHHHL